MKKLNIFIILFIITIVLIPINIKALSYSTWNSNLRKTAELVEKKNYIYDYDNDYNGAATYSGMNSQKSLTKIKSKSNWLKTAKNSKGKYYKNYYTKTNNYKLGSYCSIYGTGKKNCNNSNYWTKSFANCSKCVELDCSNYCYSGKSALGVNGCLKTLNRGGYVKGKWYTAKNPYQKKKYCNDVVGYYNKNVISNAYYNYVNNTANKNSEKLVSKGMVCHNYIKYALQKSGIYSGSDFHAKRSQLSDGTCNSMDMSKFDVLIPEDAVYTCYTKKVSWLNKSANGNRPTLSTLVNKGYVKKGDIISQFDGSGQHTEVYAGKSHGKMVIYGVGKKYQVNKSKSYGGKYGFGSGIKFLIKSKILSTQNDTRNHHNNPQVAMVIRIKNLK